MKKAIITVVGKDHSGIIAQVSAHLATNQINILNITQTIVDGYFNMMMITDIENCPSVFSDIDKELNELSKKISCVIHIQKEEIFDSMHRI